MGVQTTPKTFCIPNISQTVDKVQYNRCEMNQSLPQTFRESSKLLQQNFQNLAQEQEAKKTF
jgi:hypothetical protein